MVDQETLFYWQSPQTTELLDLFRQHYPLKHLMPCSSCTASLHIAVAALQLEPGSEVIVTGVTDMGSVIGMLYQQLVPVFCDIEPMTYNMDPQSVAAGITPKTKAIMVVHMQGNPCNMDALMALARRHDLRVIEDCAQSWGASYAGQPVGTFGDLGCYSFNDFKHLSCGDGGMVGTNDDRLGTGLSKWGDKHYDRVTGGRMVATLSPNYRITEPQAAVAAAQMEKHDAMVARRRELAGRLLAGLAGTPALRLPAVTPQGDHSWWYFVCRLDLTQLSVPRNDIAKALRAEGVMVGDGYLPSPVPGYPLFQNHDFFAGRWPLKEAGLTDMDYREVRLPVAEAMLEDCLVCTFHEELPESYIDGMIEAFGKVLRHYHRA
jgi:dTDP-4-amino-4,6-dideoxygalactose transaminase